MLLQFSSFEAKRGRTLTQIRRKIDSAWAALRSKRDSDTPISFADVRECFLNIEGMVQVRADLARPHWNISTGDIGYVVDDNFVLIANAFDNDAPSPRLCAPHEEILTIRCDPCRPYNITELPNGLRRYVLFVVLTDAASNSTHHHNIDTAMNLMRPHTSHYGTLTALP